MSAPEEKHSAFYKLMVCALLLVCSTLAFLYSGIWGFAIKFPFAIEYEGHVLWACLQLAQGKNIYDQAGLSQEPWSVVIYNPLFIFLGAALTKTFGTTFMPLRMLSMTAALISFVTLGSLLKRSRCSDFHTIIAITLFASAVPVLHWSSVARVDFLGLALALLSLERFVKAWLEKKDGRISFSWPALLFAVAAFYAKQQYFVFMLAMVLFAFLKRQRRLSLLYLGSWLGLLLVVSSAIQALTGGYWANLSYASALPWEWQTIKPFISQFLLDPKTIAATAAVIWAGCKILGKKEEEEEEEEEEDDDDEKVRDIWQLAAFLLATSLLLAAYTMGLRGAYHNHLLCSEFALFWLTGLSLKQLSLKASASQSNVLSTALAATLIVASALSLLQLNAFGKELAYRQSMRVETESTISWLRKACKSKPILSEDPSLAIFAGATPAMIDATTLLNLAEVHPQSLQALVQRLKQKSYGAVIINIHDAKEHRGFIWRNQFLEAILENYHPATNSGGNGVTQTVFRPNS
jgi:hypothetical protein